jgi:hypothetical protein
MDVEGGIFGAIAMELAGTITSGEAQDLDAPSDRMEARPPLAEGETGDAIGFGADAPVGMRLRSEAKDRDEAFLEIDLALS